MSGLRPFSLQSPRLSLRRFFLGEVDNYVAIRNDPAVLQYHPWMSSLSPADAWTFMTRQAVATPGTANTQVHVAIVDRQTARVVGDCFLRVDPSGQQGEIGVLLARAWQGRGYEQEAMRTMATWARGAPDGPRLQRLTVKVDARDINAMAAFGAAGFSMVSQGVWAGQFPYYVLAM